MGAESSEYSGYSTAKTSSGTNVSKWCGTRKSKTHRHSLRPLRTENRIAMRKEALLYIKAHPKAQLQEIAYAINVSSHSLAPVLKDLVEEHYLNREKIKGCRGFVYTTEAPEEQIRLMKSIRRTKSLRAFTDEENVAELLARGFSWDNIYKRQKFDIKAPSSEGPRP